MEIKETLTGARGKGGGGWWKEGEGTSQRTCMNDPWTWTMAWGWIMGAGGEMDGGRQRGKIGTSGTEYTIIKKNPLRQSKMP